VRPKSITRKAPRTYRSELRQKQAEQTRSRVLAAAAELFAADGYAGTTLAKIAAAAGVSAETVQGHGPKAALLIAACEYAAFGIAGEENVLNLDVGQKLLTLNGYDELLDFVAGAYTEVHGSTARLALALDSGAGSDPELERYLTELIASINLQNRRVLEVCRDRRWVRDDVPFDEVVETIAVIGSFDTYLRITHRDGWSPAKYHIWCRRMLAETVFRRPDGAAVP
jgi:AcrR family transcriptional regulator